MTKEEIPPAPFDKDLRNIDLNILHIFEAIYTTGNITRAAQRLNMNQPTVSNALGRLRQQFNDPLFLRSERGVTPTRFAENLIHPVRQALAILRDGISLPRDFDAASATRTFHLALNDFTAVSLLPGLLNEVAQRAPGIRVNVLGHTVASPLDALLGGEADIAVDSFVREVPGVDLTPIHVPSAVVIARIGHPEIRDNITKQQYCDAGHIVLSQDARMRAYAEAVLLSHGVTRRIVCEISNCVHIPPLVAATDLVAVLPAPYARQVARHYGLQVLALPFPSPNHRLQIATLKDKAKDPGLDWVRQHLYRAAVAAAAAEDWLPEKVPAE